MRSGYLLIASTVLAFATAAVADPAKPDSRENAQPQSRPAQVILASAEQIQATPSAEQVQATTPVKRPRAARVTTCRCGDQNQPKSN